MSAAINRGDDPDRRVSERLVIEMLMRRGMNDSTKDQLQGAVHQEKGKLKEWAGKVTDNPKLQAEGVAEKVAGKVQKKAGEIEKVLGK